jgi:hypothetical protein
VSELPATAMSSPQLIYQAVVGMLDAHWPHVVKLRALITQPLRISA